MSFFSKLKEGLKRTKENMVLAIEDVFDTYTKVDDAFLEELEEILIMSDVSMNTALKISDELKETVRLQHISDAKAVKEEVKRITAGILDKGEEAHRLSQAYPLIILVVGVNGVGKTTSIAKIAHGLKKEGKSVLLVAADTFRAAAAEQLVVWGERVGVHVVRHQEGSDPAAVIFDGVHAAKARGIDVVICDTAGRLHNKKNLMNELEKMNKIIDREFGEATKETLLVIDGATGQNAKSQVKEFSEITDVTGIVLTKLDGTAKGGIVISIADEFNIPVKYIGVGEGIEDMQPFVPAEFAEALFGTEEGFRDDEAESVVEADRKATETEAVESPVISGEEEAMEEETPEEEEPDLEEAVSEESSDVEASVDEEVVEDFAEALPEEGECLEEAEITDEDAELEVEAEEAESQEKQVETEQEEPKPEEKKGFWSRLFGG